MSKSLQSNLNWHKIPNKPAAAWLSCTNHQQDAEKLDDWQQSANKLATLLGTLPVHVAQYHSS
jgi:hypothetical protein